MPMQKRSLCVILCFAVVILLGSMYGFSEKNEVEPLARGDEPETSAEEITVYVCGAVNQPGVVRLNEGARIVDAVKLCGGALPNADTTKINMAQPLKDGMQVTVPEKIAAAPAAARGETPPARAIDTPSADGKININTADKAQLDKLPGVGPAMAEAIIAYRETEGRFQTPEDIMKVRGIGEAKFKKMKDKIAL